ncbi:hypothetical protein BD414DRAFT_175366 [Trametes punicea]|nr:hypothetical protein BD414DRAFT_175366 [Trametes punicea]
MSHQFNQCRPRCRCKISLPLSPAHTRSRIQLRHHNLTYASPPHGPMQSGVTGSISRHSVVCGLGPYVRPGMASPSQPRLMKLEDRAPILLPGEPMKLYVRCARVAQAPLTSATLDRPCCAALRGRWRLTKNMQSSGEVRAQIARSVSVLKFCPSIFVPRRWVCCPTLLLTAPLICGARGSRAGCPQRTRTRKRMGENRTQRHASPSCEDVLAGDSRLASSAAYDGLLIVILFQPLDSTPPAPPLASAKGRNGQTRLGAPAPLERGTRLPHAATRAF